MTTPDSSTVPPVVHEVAASPIADLSYRHYDGPLQSRMARWWIIALAGMRPVLRKWWFWVLVLLATAPYVLWGFMLFLESRLGPEFRQMVFETAKDQRFATVFLRAYESSLFWIMILALVIGAPSIAADNRTNALQVYLSKPVTKLDYLLGKWASVFVVVMVAMLVPSLLLFLYCLLSFWSSGFLRNEPFLILRVIGAAAITAGGFASLFVGISAWCRSTMVAGAVGAGVYLASQVIASVLWGVLYFRSWQAGHLASGTLVQHCSVGGVMTGLVWNLYGVVLRVPIRHNPAQGFIEVHAPNVGVMLAAYTGLVIIGAIAAYVRVRAVEVVTS